ncbi:MAG: FeS assembly protein SufD [Parcubacteria group bacterium Gr01-1014_30]|nr:MAG: FeS assembly protein SufD [Parcubacteria group bacterium Gr01-1014_30]
MDIFLKENEHRDCFMPDGGGGCNVYLGRNSSLRFFTFNLGGKSLKNELNVVFKGKGARAELYGLYLPQDGQVIENETLLRHQAPSCESFQRYYGILPMGGKAVFNGKILIERKAQKTKAYLESKNILLSPDAQMLGRPFLEIFADDVQCTHGFSSSQIEEDEIFYLRSRGHNLESAKRILLLSFAQRNIDKVADEETKNILCERISRFLSEKLEAKN